MQHRHKWIGESAFESVQVRTDSNVSHISSGGGGLVYTTEDPEGQELNIVLSDGTIVLDNIRIISDAAIQSNRMWSYCPRSGSST